LAGEAIRGVSQRGGRQTKVVMAKIWSSRKIETGYDTCMLGKGF
jgi:hypothetical protein